MARTYILITQGSTLTRAFLASVNNAGRFHTTHRSFNLCKIAFLALTSTFQKINPLQCLKNRGGLDCDGT